MHRESPNGPTALPLWAVAPQVICWYVATHDPRVGPSRSRQSQTETRMNARSWRSLGLLALMLGDGTDQAEAAEGLADAHPTIAYCEATETAADALPGICQGETTGDEGTDATDQKRKDYIKRVLSKSAGKSSRIDLRGKQLARAGSGFFIAEDGTLVTNYRLVDGCALISVSPTFGEMAAAVLVGADREADLALLRAEVVPPRTASFTGSTGALYGEPTYVIGYPNLGATTDEPTLTSVRILGSQKTAFSLSTIVIEGAIRSGNNGGALLDSSGGVIGIVLASTTQTYAATGSDVDIIGLALPNETLQDFLHKNRVEDRVGLKLPPKSEDRLLIDSRPFMVQVGCWR